MLKRFAARVNDLTQQRVRAAAENCCNGARARAPVDTGRLRASIRIEQKGLSARVIADCDYAALVEFGTSRTPPKPFMRE